MAKLPPNSPLKGIRGRIQDIVFREVDGETIVSVRPSIPRWRLKDQSDRQRQTRTNFKKASLRAKMITRTDPVMKEHYRKKAKELKLPNAYTAALKEYMLTDIQEP